MNKENSKVIVDKSALNESYPIPNDTLVVNLNTLQTIFEGSHRAAVVMINQFTRDCFNDLDSIKHVILSKNKQDVNKILHYFKGPVSYLGADRILYAIHLLTLKNEGNNELSLQDIQMLEIELNQFVVEIKKLELTFLNNST